MTHLPPPSNPRDKSGPDSHRRLTEMAPVYVVDGLAPGEHAEFEDHVVLCRVCRDEVVRLRASAVVFAQAVAAASATAADGIGRGARGEQKSGGRRP